MSFIDDSLQGSDKVAPLIKLLVMLKCYCLCIENLKAPIVLVNGTRLKKNLLKLNPKLETASRKKEVLFRSKMI